MKSNYKTLDMKDMWDARYAVEEFVYGTAPNDFFTASLEGLEPGTMLLPGEGEGRNAAHALKLGWSVHAFDLSDEARKKAMQLAGTHLHSIRYEVCDLRDFSFRKNTFDTVALIFFHVPPALRSYLHDKAFEALKPGGRLILQAFHSSQLGKGTGGPQDPEMLMTKSLLEKDFSLLEPLMMEECTLDIREGPFHQGEANVINYIGIKN